MTTETKATKRRRGRPQGSGKDDSGALRKLTAFILDHPSVKPMTAIKTICRRPSDSDTRRIYNKWCVQGANLQAAELERRRGAGERAVPRRTSGGDLFWPRGHAVSRELEKLPFFQGLRALQHAPEFGAIRAFQRAVDEAQNNPLTRAVREMENSPLLRAVREMQNSPVMKAVKAYTDSPVMRAAREMKECCALFDGSFGRSALLP